MSDSAAIIIAIVSACSTYLYLYVSAAFVAVIILSSNRLSGRVLPVAIFSAAVFAVLLTAYGFGTESAIGTATGALVFLYQRFRP